MANCGPGDQLIDPPNNFKGDRVPRDIGSHARGAISFYILFGTAGD